jgi:GNAT superfamily N-acetyltransferase
MPLRSSASSMHVLPRCPGKRVGMATLLRSCCAKAWSFFGRRDGAPADCCGVQLVGTEYGELKQMYVRPQFRGVGLGTRRLEHLADYTRQRRVTVLGLETGIHQAEAIGLYKAGKRDATLIALFVGEFPFHIVERCYSGGVLRVDCSNGRRALCPAWRRELAVTSRLIGWDERNGSIDTLEKLLRYIGSRRVPACQRRCSIDGVLRSTQLKGARLRSWHSACPGGVSVGLDRNHAPPGEAQSESHLDSDHSRSVRRPAGRSHVRIFIAGALG